MASVQDVSQAENIIRRHIIVYSSTIAAAPVGLDLSSRQRVGDLSPRGKMIAA